MDADGDNVAIQADPLRFIENAKDTLCRNVTIYGKCRYEDKGMSNQML
jgi:hypothetical protein